MIVHSRIEGAQLVGNLLGDPTERDLFVYLPPGYQESDSRYPTARPPFLTSTAGTQATTAGAHPSATKQRSNGCRRHSSTNKPAKSAPVSQRTPLV